MQFFAEVEPFLFFLPRQQQFCACPTCSQIFHQSEHLLCMLRQMQQRKEVPSTILWPYSVTPWTSAVTELLLPQTRVVSTCCGKEKIAASWWTGERRVCACWQRVCPDAESRATSMSFWPGRAGKLAHVALRRAVRMHCRAHSPTYARDERLARRGGVVRLVTRPAWAGRQLEDASQTLTALRAISGVKQASVAVADVAQARAATGRGSGSNASAFLCAQAAWYANAAIVVTVHGSQTTNAIFADEGALVVDVQPYAYKPEASAPRDYCKFPREPNLRPLQLPSVCASKWLKALRGCTLVQLRRCQTPPCSRTPM